MKSENILVLFLALCTVIPSTMVGISMASLPYPFNTWHANAKTYAQRQEDIQSYSLTVKIKHRTKTIKEQSFTAFDYKKVITKALRYLQKEQRTGLKAIFKPSIRLVKNWDIYPLGNVVQKGLPADLAERVNYWQQAEQTITNSFYVSSPTQKPKMVFIKKVLSLGYIRLTLLSCLVVFLLGIISLHFVSRKKI